MKVGIKYQKQTDIIGSCVMYSDLKLTQNQNESTHNNSIIMCFPKRLFSDWCITSRYVRLCPSLMTIY